MQLAILHLSESADGHLAASTKAVQEGTFASRCSASVRIIQKREQVAHPQIALADLDPYRPLSRRGAHDFRGDDLLNQFRFAEPLQARGRKDDRVVLSLLKFSQAGIDVA